MVEFEKKQGREMLTIIGYGAMAEAIIEGVLKNGIEVEVVGRDEKKLQEISKKYGIATYSLQNFDIENKELLLAVKPYALQEVASKVQGKAKILYSILAGTPISTLQRIPANHYVRAMPNIAATNQASMTTLTGDETVKGKAVDLFKNIGDVLWVGSEKALDIATAIAGSGPAFLALVAEAIADGGVYCGLKREEAQILTKGLFKSFASIIDDNPAKIKDKVMSPAGTTAAGYKALEEKAVRSAFIEAIAKAYERTKR